MSNSLLRVCLGLVILVLVRQLNITFMDVTFRHNLVKLGNVAMFFGLVLGAIGFLFSDRKCRWVSAFLLWPGLTVYVHSKAAMPFLSWASVGMAVLGCSLTILTLGGILRSWIKTYFPQPTVVRPPS